MYVLYGIIRPFIEAVRMCIMFEKSQKFNLREFSKNFDLGSSAHREN